MKIPADLSRALTGFRRVFTGVNKQSKTRINDREKITVILTGFWGKDVLGNWSGETAPFLKEMKDLLDVRNKVRLCNLAYEGELYGSRVLVAATGMAKVKTTACLSEILHVYDKKIREVILVGIAGITPMKGGILDSLGKVRKSEPAMLGDVCVSFLAVDYDLQHYGADCGRSSLPEPKFWDQKSTFQAKFIKGDKKLADELLSACKKVRWPAVPKGVEKINTLYHSGSRFPKVWEPWECLEVTSDLYWHDLRSDCRARELAGGLLRREYGRKISPDSVLVVSSMEAVACGAVVEWWNRDHKRAIGFSYVRGASNFSHPYVDTDGKPVLGALESLKMSAKSGGASYAMQTEALPVLKMLELRSYV